MATRPRHNGMGVRRAIKGFLITALCALVGAIVMMASLPPVSRDALTHHLAIPKLFLQHGILTEFPDIPFSYYPMNLDLLYLLPLAVGNDILAKYIHFFFGLATAGLIHYYLKIRIGQLWGLCGALLWLSTPIVVRLSSEVYVDLGLGLFSMAAVCSIIRWSESGGHWTHLLWAGFWCGLALGTKYNALLVLAILTALIPFVFLRIKSLREPAAEPERTAPPGNKPSPSTDRLTHPSSIRALISAILFAGVALIIFSPWMVRNTMLKGNPIYPMMNQVFNPSSSSAQDDWSRTATMVQDTSNTLTVRRLVFKESLGHIALIPFRIFFEGQDDDPRYFDGKLNPFLLVFIIGAIGFWRADNRRLASERWVWFSFAVLFVLMAIFLAPIRIRYLLPILPAFIVLAVTGVYNAGALVEAIRHPVARFTGYLALAVAVLAMFGLNADYIVKRYRHLEPWAYLSGHIARDEYITKRRSEYPLIKYVNAHLAADARILALFLGQRRYYFERDIIFSEDWIAKSVARSNTPDEIRQRLKALGITHLMVRRDLFQRWIAFTLAPAEIDRLNLFWEAHTRKLRDSGEFALFIIT